jgi:uncharacterized protein (TIGR02284 family)
MRTSTESNESVIDALNELLRGELSAVESYDKALPAIDKQPKVRADLQTVRASHEARADRLRSAIEQLGGKPADAAGAWGMFAKAVTTGSRALGLKAVISTLEEGEDHGLKEYKEAMPKLDPGLQRLVTDELDPQQLQTHGMLSALKRVALS